MLLYDRDYLNDTEFLGHFRVRRSAFSRLVDLISANSVFQTQSRHPRRGHADLHLMILLKYLGSDGNDNTAPKLALFFGLGKGSIDLYLSRAVKAFLALQDSTMTWPDVDERHDIACRIQAKYGFPNCVGMVDGTLLPLEYKPSVDGEDYYTRKGGYAVNAIITCDDIARVRDVVIGWPGSVHDNARGRTDASPSTQMISSRPASIC